MKKAMGLSMAMIAIVFAGFAWAQGNADKGKAIYARQCASCHGVSGKGDGPAAAALNPKPKDMSNKAYMAELKDQYLVDVVKKGGPATGKSAAMPAFGATLKDQDIQDVVAYIRSLAK